MKMHIFHTAAFFIYLNVIYVDTEIIAVVQVISNGKSTPKSFYKTDTYNQAFYWGGLANGQLINEGKRQQYTLGQYTRKRYGEFLPTKYNKSDFYAQTTDVDTSHMSIQTFIYGIFPAKQSQIWRRNIDWQAIPVHPADVRVFMYSYPSDCEAYNTLLNEQLNSDEYDLINLQNSDLYSYLTNYTGDNITDLPGVYKIWGTLYSEDLVGYTLPSWTDQIYPEPIRTVAGLYYKLLTHTTEMKSLMTGPFFNEILDYFDNMTNDSSSSQKFRIYSGHDTNIATYLITIGTFSPAYPPPPASSLYIELHAEDDDHIVKVFYKNGNSIGQVEINGCESNCTLSAFRETISDILLDTTTRDEQCSS
ncbi:testicular acid phosphatase homolog [Diorhabda carinulata]|uniref:testicular acid phosphatase homolog n=1 Tax=Diorhabda carinulata TaxID=1163345 RepID=UPI0025A0A214|nr:testicular acid phosphatase homolog [Diorhabda carinulata]